MRSCPICKQEKDDDEFLVVKNGVNKGRLSSRCRGCRKAYRKMHLTIPWIRKYQNIYSRCCGKKHHYYKMGIKAMISTDEVKYLWFRDNASVMKKPTIDRIDSKGNYTLENCRFIEAHLNVSGKKSK